MIKILSRRRSKTSGSNDSAWCKVLGSLCFAMRASWSGWSSRRTKIDRAVRTAEGNILHYSRTWTSKASVLEGDTKHRIAFLHSGPRERVRLGGFELLLYGVDSVICWVGRHHRHRLEWLWGFDSHGGIYKRSLCERFTPFFLSPSYIHRCRFAKNALFFTILR